ncbi:MAG TPA: sigma-54 dependent transcriptional regulator [Terriglobales bacterium]|nr:sigma-54 dependent transcriptional regulator [Terriglobales bacterium]
MGEEKTPPYLLIILVAEATDAAERVLPALRAARSVSTPLLAVLSPAASQEVRDVACAVADDFVFLPLRDEDFQRRVRRLLGPQGFEAGAVGERLLTEFGIGQLVGEDPEFVRVVQRIPMMGRSRAPVMICGETGTGKEIYARALHAAGARRDGPFIPVDCAAVPDSLIENELFGHMRGAFTDAHADRKGLIALAEGGTLFLDEIDSLSLMAQAKLLRLLQERSYRPLGSERMMGADVRVIAATNRRLEDWVAEKRFRSDLYFRLNVLRVQLPPLRERPGDLEILATYLLRQICAEAGVGERRLNPSVLRKLRAHDWPGNVRELFNVLQRALVYAGEGTILPSHIEVGEAAPAGEQEQSFARRKAQAVAHFERAYIEELLRKHGGNITRAAGEAGKERRAFGRLVKKYGLSAHSQAG